MSRRILSADQALEVFQRAVAGRQSQRRIAKAYGVSGSTVSAILNGASYSEITGSERIYSPRRVRRTPPRSIQEAATSNPVEAPAPFTQTQIAPGDVVTLASGGPAMTVVRLDGDTAILSYFVGTKLKAVSLEAGALVRAPREAPLCLCQETN